MIYFLCNDVHLIISYNTLFNIIKNKKESNGNFYILHLLNSDLYLFEKIDNEIIKNVIISDLDDIEFHTTNEVKYLFVHFCLT